jgi:hypothetical protein
MQQQAVAPKDWRTHRNLFHYKGKNTDPYCLSNYRGLGIDQMLLKVFSLLMMERLELFLSSTGGLSGLQGGFQRQRGPIEQAFTLAETVRVATQRKTAYLLFLDIEQAYDSVIRPILWKRCLDKGIDGWFLAALQAIYYRAEAKVDAGGILLDPVPLEVGVLQGNPLSPALFNIYIDGAIQKLMERGAALSHPFGIPLPLYQRGSPLPAYNAAAHDELGQQEHLPCLYFADDGCLISLDPSILQVMLTITVDELAALGLSVNVRKTKWMVVPKHSVTEHEYEQTVKPAALKYTPQVGTQPVSLVDEFDYLGVTMWWRWDWSKAWRTAQNRARRCYFGALRGGWQHRVGSMNSQMEYARAIIFCHFNYIAPLTGAGGGKTNAPWLANEDIITWVLRAVSGQRFANADALRAEAGVWPWQRRCDMLLLRMWCKYISMPTSCVFYRAMCLSLQSLSQEQRNNPSGTRTSNRKDLRHRQPWAQQLLAAAARNGISNQQVDQLQHGLVVVQVDPLGDGSWTASTGIEGKDTPVRLVSTAAIASGIAPEQGVDCWLMPAGTVAADALLTWTEAHKQACHAELRRLCNKRRQVQVRLFLANQLWFNTRLRLWATTLSGSFEQPYWRLANVTMARRMLALRLDMCPTEDYVRCRPHKGLPAVPNPNGRACYLCACIDDVPHVYWPETLVHVLLRCTCPELVELRGALRRDLQLLADDAATLQLTVAAGVPRPVFANDTALLTAMQLCIGIGPTPPLQQMPIDAPAGAATRGVAQRRAIARQSSPQYVRDPQVATDTARWVRALTDDWCDIFRDVYRRDNPSIAPGGRLTNLVARHAVNVVGTRRKLLKKNAAFARRERDPGSLVPLPEVDRKAVQSQLNFSFLFTWPTSITDESTGSASQTFRLDSSSPPL